MGVGVGSDFGTGCLGYKLSKIRLQIFHFTEIRYYEAVI